MIKKIGKIEIVTMSKKSTPQDGERSGSAEYGVKGDNNY